MTEKEARGLLKEALDPHKHKKHEEYLRGLARMQMNRIPSLYQTQKARGWDVMVDSIVATSPAGSSAS
jgi:hypothetical protein